MTYIINPIWFYLMDVCNNLQTAFVVLAITTGLIGVGFLITLAVMLDSGYKFEDESDATLLKKIKKTFTTAFIFCGVFIVLGVATPSKEGITKMLIASVITQENIESVKGDTKELIDYITEKVIEIKQEEDK